ncbi:hypothetical protein KIN20_031214 [Parelaphostrongylus tenuis]|uniref:Uncharacterized protein n=1 Tax=Parelaphostrongylus tenuis TaxID=148309 RepID=A0AAD5R4U1_PARTN|nr:hypothetical protein KIN20_031214 [Parelaphostrongylus tenuis]
MDHNRRARMFNSRLFPEANRGCGATSSISSEMSSIEEELQKVLKETLNSLAKTLKCRLEPSLEALRSEKLDLENRLQVMQNENERLQRELESMRQLGCGGLGT